MKKALLLTVSVFLYLNSNAQTNTFPGPVGIGTTTPSSLLDLGGNAPVLTFTRTAGAFNGIEYKSFSTLYGYSKVDPNSGEFRQWVGPSTGWGGFHTFYTDTQERMRITPAGYVGIGLTTPSSPFHVYKDGTAFTGDYKIVSKIHAATVAGTPGIYLGYNASTLRGMIAPVPIGGGGGLDIIVYDGISSYNTAQTILYNGNVGIGTTTPKEKLSVNGKIRAQEIKVESANWPDYVFEEDYKPVSLQETEQYIKTHKHLPEMPSEAEVKAEGISLGEMNAKLLKKIEELTLHLIEQDKRNEMRDNLVAEQNKKIEVLQKKLIEIQIHK